MHIDCRVWRYMGAASLVPVMPVGGHQYLPCERKENINISPMNKFISTFSAEKH